MSAPRETLCALLQTFWRPPTGSRPAFASLEVGLESSISEPLLSSPFIQVDYILQLVSRTDHIYLRNSPIYIPNSTHPLWSKRMMSPLLAMILPWQGQSMMDIRFAFLDVRSNPELSVCGGQGWMQVQPVVSCGISTRRSRWSSLLCQLRDTCLQPS